MMKQKKLIVFELAVVDSVKTKGLEWHEQDRIERSVTGKFGGDFNTLKLGYCQHLTVQRSFVDLCFC